MRRTIAEEIHGAKSGQRLKLGHIFPFSSFYCPAQMSARFSISPPSSRPFLPTE
jgi:hypothetical protein